MPRTMLTVYVLSLLCSHIYHGAHSIDVLVDEPLVQAWKFTAGQDSGVVKRWPAYRLARCGQQVGQ